MRLALDQPLAADKTWLEWLDGDHCLYNPSLEQHTVVADWFADRLKPGSPATGQ
ncbi:hypothetical protein [Amycolatopsis sp. GA6-003]|uniref:hypothetical protein n=1 Tax=Amycolatopsis sp. GA6-003 TaxID=2652444 RepID=UPI003916CD3A